MIMLVLDHEVENLILSSVCCNFTKLDCCLRVNNIEVLKQCFLCGFYFTLVSVGLCSASDRGGRQRRRSVCVPGLELPSSPEGCV